MRDARFPIARYVAAAVCVVLLGGCGGRSARWAQPVDEPGLPNLHRVSPMLYRGAEPTPAGIDRLDDLGVATVINLQSRRDSRAAVESAGLAYERVPFKAWQPDEREVVAFLRRVTDERGGPYLVHCYHGADRTGVMCAAYRIAVQGWSKEEAIREMRWGGYGFHWHMQHLAAWVRGLDVERVKAEAGIE